MNRMWSKKILLITLSLFFASTATFSAEESFTVDTLERMLEMDRHKQLITQKKNSKSTLSAFTTDGCSGGLSVGWEYLAGKIQGFQVNHGAIPPWQACCIKHDQAYHTGGERDNNATKSFEDRKKADLALRACVFDTGDTRAAELQKEYQLSREEVHRLYIVIADLMYRAVRVGGMPCTGLPWRWGYGWPKCE